MSRNTLRDLKPDPQNARRHNPRNVGMIENALREVGAARSIVIDENGIVLAGNATIEAAAAAGIENVQIIDADGETIVAVRRSGLTEEQKQRLALYDNRAAELADWDADVLAAMRDMGATDGMFFDAEIDQIIGAPVEDFDPNAEWVGMPEYENEDTRPLKQLIVNFQRESDVERFAQLVDQRITMSTKSIWYPSAPSNEYADTVWIGAQSDEDDAE